MIVELTENMIQDAFAKTGIDQKYYPQYYAMAKNRYEAFQKDDPDSEETPESECNAIASLNVADDYIFIYSTEKDKGHCHEWCHSYAFDFLSGGTIDMHVQAALKSLNEDEKNRELEIHANSIKDNPRIIESYLSRLKRRKKAKDS